MHGEINSRPVVAKSPRFRVNSGYHAIRSRHSTPLTSSKAYDVAISKSCLFGQTENTVRETTAPVGQPLFEAFGSLIGSDLLDNKSYFRNCHRRQRQFCTMTDQPCDHCLVGRLFRFPI